MGSELGAAEDESVEAVGASRDALGSAVVADQQAEVGAAAEDGEAGGTAAGRGRHVAVGHGASLRVGISLSMQDPNQVMSDDVTHPTLPFPWRRRSSKIKSF